MTQPVSSVEPGWRPDPSGRFDWRYWDGGWTNRVANSAPSEFATPATDLPGEAPAVLEETTPAEAVPSVPPVTRVEPFGAPDPAPHSATTTPKPARTRRSPWVAIVAFLRSFADQPESYHSPYADELPPDPRRSSMTVTAPGNYGRAGIIALAACGIAGGAYLPWLSGTIDSIAFQRSGFDMGDGLGYSLGAIALATAALLSVHVRIMRFVTLGVTLVLAGFVARDLVHTYDAMQSMNAATRVDANVGTGLWIMVVSAAISMIASARLTEHEKIV
jgi:hypothetical protein